MTVQFLPHDFESPTWRRLVQRFEEDLAQARSELENMNLDDKPVSATRLRARISLIKRYLAMPDVLAQQNQEPTDGE